MIAPQEDREAIIRRWMEWRGTPPFASSPEWEEAQRRKMMGGMGGMGNVHPLVALLQQYMARQQPQRTPTLSDFMRGF